MRMLMRAAGLRIERMRRHAHHQAAVLYAFESDNQVGKLLHAAGFAMNDQDLEA